MKPKGEDLKNWCHSWAHSDHEGKVNLARTSGITYETARHWFSDAQAEYKETGEPKMRMDVADILGMRPAINLDFVAFDIETSNLNADFSILLSAVIKPFGMPPIVFRADDYPEWQANRANDFAITKAISDELRRHAIVITHYGAKFDIPFLRAKMTHHRLEPLPPMFGIDSWAIAWKNFKLSSRRLKNLGKYFDAGDKDGVEGALWMEAAYSGSRDAMDAIVEHNIIDCEALEKLAAISFPFVRSIPRL